MARTAQRNPAYRVHHAVTKILLIEPSTTLALELKHGIERQTGAIAVQCGSLGAAEQEIAAGGVTFAVTGLKLPDARGGMILERLEKQDIPVLVYCDADMAEQVASFNAQVIDHVVKGDSDAVSRILDAVTRTIENSAFKVLVVDDTRTARSVLIDLLARRQFQVLGARSGTEALDIMAAHQNNIDLVITDYHMPDMDGYELTRRIRALKTSEELRIVGVSASTDRGLSAQFLKAGASDFIYRPFVPEELQCRIDNNIETLKQLRRLKYYAERDPLTSLSNRRHFFETGIRLAREAERLGQNSAVAILDIDHFKKVNDTYGHEAGDIVLKAIATLLSASVDGGPHLVARLGGEEFAFYLCGISGKAAYDFFDGIRAAIEATEIPFKEQVLTVTASFGVADVTPGETFDNYLNAADQFLYMAKNRGRNRVFSEGTMLGLF